MPTNTELHAAACIPMMQWGVGVARQALAESEQSLAAARALPAVQQAGPEYLEGLRRGATEQLEGTESALKRLQAYLMPRLTLWTRSPSLRPTIAGRRTCESCTDNQRVPHMLAGRDQKTIPPSLVSASAVPMNASPSRFSRPAETQLGCRSSSSSIRRSSRYCTDARAGRVRLERLACQLRNQQQHPGCTSFCGAERLKRNLMKCRA